MTETTKSLPQIYREAADLVLKVGKVEGSMKEVSEGKCFGFCTMGAVFEAAGHMDAYGFLQDDGFVDTDEFLRLASPVADQIVSSCRYQAQSYRAEKDRVFWAIADWSDGDTVDGHEPTAQDVAALLRETADAVEAAA